jgi:hypothetical protein
MKQTIDKGAFRDAFDRMGRGGQFSYEALGMIFDHLTELEEGTGVETELDPIAVCCEFTEYADIDALREAFDHLLFSDDGPLEVIRTIEDHTGGVLRRFTDEAGPFIVAH